MSILLIYFLTILSYTNTLHPWLIEASTRTNNGFSIDLFHRYYSPISPFYNSSMSPKELLQRLVLSSNSRHQQIIWQQSNIEVSTNLIPNVGDYLMQISVGTPPVQLVAAAVTGSDLTWFQCRPCVLCYPHNTTNFDPQASKTYKNLPCDAEHCSNLNTGHINCDQNENLCRYWYTYGNATTITGGVMGTDTFSFSSFDGDEEQAAFPSITFGCGYQQAGFFDSNSAGVVGLGNGPVSLVSQLGPSISYKFSYCLTYPSSHRASKLRFGGMLEDTSEIGGLTTPFVTNDPSSSYSLELNGISVGQLNLNMNREIIIDTGTTLTYIDPSIFYKLEAMVNDAIGASPVSNNPLVEPVLCYDPDESALNPPDIVFQLSGGDLVLKANNIFFVLDHYLCLSIAKSPKDGDPMVLGNMAQTNLEIEFNLLSKTVRFTPKYCSQESS
ncbi:probable aspartic protease At2g35615 [Chenopodium quinoa]|nr:probable aspartic protease At2g35615 [Chenopodium quinoa]